MVTDKLLLLDNYKFSTEANEEKRYIIIAPAPTHILWIIVKSFQFISGSSQIGH
jgi:hypothetical protein